jgi:hypothetical protein
VAEWIGDLGLADYYRLRTTSATPAPDLDDASRSAAALARPELARHIVRRLVDGRARRSCSSTACAAPHAAG